ncbi:hypothetical protein OAK82_03000 [Candidatus Thioglobus sp.]|nr:hypothetical protein [Candidatus Thioglobus sp.]
MKLFLKILLVLFVIGVFFRWMGHQELNNLIEEGVLDSDYTQLELAMLCEKLDFEVIFWGCLTGGVW